MMLDIDALKGRKMESFAADKGAAHTPT